VGTAQVAGQMYNLGAYPGLVLPAGQEQGARVQGEVYAIEPALEAVLDEIEEIFPQATGGYAKREMDVLVDGATVRCIVYEINPARTVGKPLMAGGDWFQRA
ncbi:MAG: gamma-glutamylcyclotransferase, partial [Xylophilus sp.]|nr:gamma-glutamylcyclotransferase [Xylophilus sp.]